MSERLSESTSSYLRDLKVAAPREVEHRLKMKGTRDVSTVVPDILRMINATNAAIDDLDTFVGQLRGRAEYESLVDDVLSPDVEEARAAIERICKTVKAM